MLFLPGAGEGTPEHWVQCWALQYEPGTCRAETSQGRRRMRGLPGWRGVSWGGPIRRQQHLRRGRRIQALCGRARARGADWHTGGPTEHQETLITVGVTQARAAQGSGGVAILRGWTSSWAGPEGPRWCHQHHWSVTDAAIPSQHTLLLQCPSVPCCTSALCAPCAVLYQSLLCPPPAAPCLALPPVLFEAVLRTCVLSRAAPVRAVLYHSVPRVAIPYVRP